MVFMVHVRIDSLTLGSSWMLMVDGSQLKELNKNQSWFSWWSWSSLTGTDRGIHAMFPSSSCASPSDFWDSLYFCWAKTAKWWTEKWVFHGCSFACSKPCCLVVALLRPSAIHPKRTWRACEIIALPGTFARTSRPSLSTWVIRSSFGDGSHQKSGDFAWWFMIGSTTASSTNHPMISQVSLKKNMKICGTTNQIIYPASNCLDGTGEVPVIL